MYVLLGLIVAGVSSYVFVMQELKRRKADRARREVVALAEAMRPKNPEHPEYGWVIDGVRVYCDERMSALPDCRCGCAAHKRGLCPEEDL